MIYFKVKDGKEDKAILFLGGEIEAIFVQSEVLIETIIEMIQTEIGTEYYAKIFTEEFIAALNDFYNKTFSNGCNGRKANENF